MLATPLAQEQLPWNLGVGMAKHHARWWAQSHTLDVQGISALDTETTQKGRFYDYYSTCGTSSQ